MSRIIVLLALLLPYTQHSRAQELFRYDSLYEVKEGLLGKADFQYSKDRSGTPLRQGAFSFVAAQMDTTCATRAKDVVWTGSYKDDLKDGAWEYTELLQEVEVVGFTDTFKVNLLLSTLRERIRGTFDKGVPEGPWTLSSRAFENGRPIGAGSSASLLMSQAKVSGRFEAAGTDVRGHPYRISGEALDGLMVGPWELELTVNGSVVREVRDYVKGFLRTLRRMDAGTGDTLLVVDFPLSKEVQKVMEGGRTSLRPANVPLSLNFSDGYPRSSTYLSVQRPGGALIDQVLKQVFKNDDGVYRTNGLPLGTNRLIHPLSDTEEQLLASWPELVRDYEESVMRLASLQDEFSRFATNDTLEHIHRWVALQQDVLGSIAPWGRSFENKEIEFYDRKGMLLDHAAETLLMDSLHLPHSEVIILFGEASREEGLLQFVTANMEDRMLYADSLERLYQDVIAGLSLDESIASLASRIEEVAASTGKALRDGVTDERVAPFADRMRSVYVDAQLNEAVSRFRDFNASREVQRAFGDSIVSAYAEVEDMLQVASRIYRRADAIDTLYTEYVFDPYTFNDRFPRRIKRRLYQFAAEETFAMLVAEALRATDAALMRRWLQRIEDMQRMLVSVLNEDTARMERRIRTKMTLEQRLELLGID